MTRTPAEALAEAFAELRLCALEDRSGLPAPPDRPDGPSCAAIFAAHDAGPEAPAGPASPAAAIPAGPDIGFANETSTPPAATAGVVAEAEIPAGHRLVVSAEDARRAVAGLLERGDGVGLDLETTGLDPLTDRPRLLQLAGPGMPVLIVDLFQAGGLAALADLLPHLRGIAHHALFELGFLRAAGIRTGLGCTMVAENVLIGEALVSLQAVALRRLGVTLDKDLQTSDWSGELSKDQLRYAARDAAVLSPLAGAQARAMRAEGSLKTFLAARDALPAVAEMRHRGAAFDREAHAGLMAALRTEAERYDRELLVRIFGTSPGSANQVARWLEGVLEPAALKAWPRTASGRQLSTKGDDLTANLSLLPPDKLDLVVNLLLPLKRVTKLRDGFGETLTEHIHPATGRIHADFRVAATVSGRMACADPNLQQIPRDRRFRALFVAPARRTLVIADYGQIELRVAALLAGEERLLAAIREGRDPHTLTAALLLGKPVEAVTKEERQLAKAVNFGLLYGQGARGLLAYAASNYGVAMTLEEAERHRAAWFAAYPAFARWQERTRHEGPRLLAVRTVLGRVQRWDPEGWKLTEALNTPVQGSAAEGLMRALARLPAALAGLDAFPVLAAHDEIVLEVAEEDAGAAARALERAMVEGMLEVLPELPERGLAEVKIGRSWAEKG